jgi:AcrR family transcriptional regulator
MGVAERKEREKEQRRNAIIDAAEKVFFSKGVENATMDEVATAAELSKGTLYLYFKNKGELLHGIIARGLDILFKMFKKAAKKEKAGIDKVKAIGDAYFDFYKKYPNYFFAMLHQETDKVDPEIIEKSPNYSRCNQIGNNIFALIQEAAKTGIEDGTIRQDLDPVKLSLVLWGHSAGILQIFNAKEPVIGNHFGASLDEVVEYSNRLILDYLDPSVKRKKAAEAKN